MIILLIKFDKLKLALHAGQQSNARMHENMHTCTVTAQQQRLHLQPWTTQETVKFLSI